MKRLLPLLVLAAVPTACSSADPGGAETRESEGQSVTAATAVLPPSFTPTSMVVNQSTVDITIASPTTGATVCYTLNGTSPACSGAACATGSLTYKTPIPVSAASADSATRQLRVEAIACEKGMSPSPVESQVYVFQAADPVLSPPSSVLDQPTHLTITDRTSGATLCYTTGITSWVAVPECSTTGGCAAGSSGYVAKTGVLVSENGMWVSVIACDAHMLPSDPITQTYDLQAAPPVFSPASTSSKKPVKVTLTTATPGASLCYTADGVEPMCNGQDCASGSTTYAPATGITVGTTETVRAIACAAGMVTSVLVAETYDITP